MAESAVSFKASDGVELEGMLRQLPDATAACIVMHPHTQMGGNIPHLKTHRQVLSLIESHLNIMYPVNFICIHQSRS